MATEANLSFWLEVRYSKYYYQYERRHFFIWRLDFLYILWLSCWPWRFWRSSDRWTTEKMILLPWLRQIEVLSRVKQVIQILSQLLYFFWRFRWFQLIVFLNAGWRRSWRCYLVSWGTVLQGLCIIWIFIEQVIWVLYLLWGW